MRRDVPLVLFLVIFALAVPAVVAYRTVVDARPLPPVEWFAGSKAAVPTAPRDLRSCLPARSDRLHLARTGEIRTFGPDTLFDYINGGAEVYLDYGFRKVVTADYGGGEDDLPFVVDIYDMGDGANAFGMYRLEEAPGLDAADLGEEGRRDPLTLGFRFGRYYVKITAPEMEMEDALMDLGASLVSRLPRPEGPFRPEARLPREGLRPESITFVSKNYLGRAALRRVVSAVYAAGDGEYTVAVLDLPPGEGGAALDELAESMERQGAEVKTDGALRRVASVSESASWQEMWFGAAGDVAFLVLDPPDPETVRAVCEALARLAAGERAD